MIAFKAQVSLHVEDVHVLAAVNGSEIAVVIGGLVTGVRPVVPENNVSCDAVYRHAASGPFLAVHGARIGINGSGHPRGIVFKDNVSANTPEGNGIFTFGNVSLHVGGGGIIGSGIDSPSYVGVCACRRLPGGIPAEQNGLGILESDCTLHKQGTPQGLPLCGAVSQLIVGEGDVAHVGKGGISAHVHGSTGVGVGIHDGLAAVEGKIPHVREDEHFRADRAPSFIIVGPAVAVDGGTIFKTHGHSRAAKRHDGRIGGRSRIRGLVEENAACVNAVVCLEVFKRQVFLQIVGNISVCFLPGSDGALVKVFTLLGRPRLHQGRGHEEQDGGYC